MLFKIPKNRSKVKPPKLEITYKFRRSKKFKIENFEEIAKIRVELQYPYTVALSLAQILDQSLQLKQKERGPSLLSKRKEGAISAMQCFLPKYLVPCLSSSASLVDQKTVFCLQCVKEEEETAQKNHSVQISLFKKSHFTTLRTK